MSFIYKIGLMCIVSLLLSETDRRPFLIKECSGSSPKYYEMTETSDFTQVGNTIFFTTKDRANGRELWKTDGTAKGTVMVKDINPGLSGSMIDAFPNRAICDGTQLLFSASDGMHGRELWESDGTSKGTHIIKDFIPGPSSSNPEGFALAGKFIYFKTTDPIHGVSLWGLKHR